MECDGEQRDCGPVREERYQSSSRSTYPRHWTWIQIFAVTNDHFSRGNAGEGLKKTKKSETGDESENQDAAARVEFE